MEEEKFRKMHMGSSRAIGSYEVPKNYKGEVHVEITLRFSDSDELSFPTTSHQSITTALEQSLDASSFVDSKFYLFSTRIRGRPAHPRAVFARSALLIDRSPYLRDMVSLEATEARGTPCDLRDDVPEEITRLDAEAFDYDDDSDLEDEDDEADVDTCKQNRTVNTAGHSATTDETNTKPAAQLRQQVMPRSSYQDGRAFAINGTAYKTWKAFIYYAYTNEIHFDELKSQRVQCTSRKAVEPATRNNVRCSPKSMYRLAESAKIPQLRSTARSGILNGLSQSNIVTELFSAFTSKYPDIIELEVDYLLKNFTEDVAIRFDDMLESILLEGNRARFFEVLAFTMRRLRGISAADAWAALRRRAPKPIIRQASIARSPRNPDGEERKPEFNGPIVVANIDKAAGPPLEEKDGKEQTEEAKVEKGEGNGDEEAKAMKDTEEPKKKLDEAQPSVVDGAEKEVENADGKDKEKGGKNSERSGSGFWGGLGLGGGGWGSWSKPGEGSNWDSFVKSGGGGWGLGPSGDRGESEVSKSNSSGLSGWGSMSTPSKFSVPTAGEKKSSPDEPTPRMASQPSPKLPSLSSSGQSSIFPTHNPVEGLLDSTTSQTVSSTSPAHCENNATRLPSTVKSSVPLPIPSVDGAVEKVPETGGAEVITDTTSAEGVDQTTQGTSASDEPPNASAEDILAIPVKVKKGKKGKKKGAADDDNADDGGKKKKKKKK
ncbi:hypothetical protein NP233_g5179 [Leucocoprinus birnbaumii]|uniref:Uncharacterized protein n=1 Tax=Leucocoprinus birnbaumii TaxID=56174 RepID=A0AAD5VTC8_9AGAR|nr:hypothetical protein NP233_g5179 [Leucocoprinus birnbaumii]